MEKKKYGKINSADHAKVVDYLVSNQEFLKEKLSHYNNLKEALLEETSTWLHPDVEQEYREEVLSYIVEVIAIDSGIDAETIWIVLEDANLKEYLGEFKLDKGEVV